MLSSAVNKIARPSNKVRKNPAGDSRKLKSEDPRNASTLLITLLKPKRR
jgi:hypothetical protein